MIGYVTKIRNFLGSSIIFVGIIILVIAVLSAIIFTFQSLSHAYGFWGILGGIFTFPVSIFADLLYEGFKYHNWEPIINSIITLAFGGVLIFIGSLIRK